MVLGVEAHALHILCICMYLYAAKILLYLFLDNKPYLCSSAQTKEVCEHEKEDREHVEQQQPEKKRICYKSHHLLFNYYYITCETFAWPNILLSNALCILYSVFIQILHFIFFFFHGITQLLLRWKSYFSITQILLYRNYVNALFMLWNMAYCHIKHKNQF